MDAWSAAAIAFVRRRGAGAPVPLDLDVDVHFHPDRIRAGRSVIDALADGGDYLPQWVTGTSNGGLTARAGGDRDRWERRMFGGAYDDAPPDVRPRYGALNRLRLPHGAAIRFGSARLVLAASARTRVTYCFPDSVHEPTRFGTDEAFALPASGAMADPLDDYVEAHVHGGLRIGDDVARVVLDPAFRGTVVEHAARSLPVAVAWHPGRVLEVETLRAHAEYRGAEVAGLGARIAEHGRLDARIVGAAAADEDPQLIKRLWHCVARFGHPAEA
jgi:hypothetical protein